jgi:hypothetical protein
VAARLALGAGEQPSSHRDRPDRAKGTTGVMYSAAATGGPASAGAGAVSAALYITARCASARYASFMTVPNEAKSNLARAVCLPPSQDRGSCAGLLL